ncbi:hypothetical protein HGB07_03135 [Candidatus Roizmanbacteria bacterium]|nr:hypothetical protein [Candidatus Roizmanbacteria bacterium]
MFKQKSSKLASMAAGAFLAANQTITTTIVVNQAALGFQIPTLSELLTFIIRFFFAIAGVFALFYMLQGGLAWVTSEGSKENVEKARNKIQAALVGIILIVLVLAIVWTLEQVVFAKTICFGISCSLTIPQLLVPYVSGSPTN